MRSKRTAAKLKGGQMDFFLPLKVGTGRATKRAHGFPKWAQRELAQEKRKRNRKGHSESSVSGRFEGGGEVLRGRRRRCSEGGGAAPLAARTEAARRSRREAARRSRREAARRSDGGPSEGEARRSEDVFFLRRRPSHSAPATATAPTS